LPPHCLLGSSSIGLEIRGGIEEESRRQRGTKEEEEVAESAESAGLLGDVAALNIILTKQPNSCALCPKL